MELVKAEGTDRIMECTLNPKFIPVDRTQKIIADVNSGKTIKPLAEHLVRVYDSEADGWRTINLKTVNTFIQN